jgi:hypothetical protein
MSPEKERAKRRRNIVILGVVLLLGFLLPILVPRFQSSRPYDPDRISEVTLKPKFVSFEAMAQEDMPGTAKFFILFPALAGITAVIVALVTDGRARGAILLALFALLVIVMLSSRDVRVGFLEMARAMGGRLGTFMILSTVAWLGIFVGSRSRWYRPGSTAAMVIGIVGGILYLVVEVLPVLPDAVGTISLVAPFKLLGQKRMVIAGLGGVVQLGCLIAASIVCFVNVNLADQRRGQRLGRVAFRLLVGGAIAAGACFVLNGMVEAGRNVEEHLGLFIFSSLFNLAKFLAWVVGVLLLLPIGLTDLVVGPPARVLPATPVPHPPAYPPPERPEGRP